MKTLSDHLGREVPLERTPRRIVSLCPSQTELVFDLGAGDRVVGVTKFCVHPDRAKESAAVVGGTKNPKIEQILRLEPDLVLAQKEENTEAVVTALAQRVPVFVTDVVDIPTALRMISDVAGLVGEEQAGAQLLDEIRLALDRAAHRVSLRALYLIWNEPLMAAGSRTFVDAVLRLGGYENVVTEARYPEIDPASLPAPDVVMLSSEPYPFREKHAAALRVHFPDARFEFVDGEMFSWYGSRMRHLGRYLSELRARLGPLFRDTP